MLARIAQTDIRRDVCARMEMPNRLTMNPLCSYTCNKPHVIKMLFPIFSPPPHPQIIRYNEWQRRHYTCDVNITKTLAKGYDSPYTTWRDVNRTGYTCSKEQHTALNTSPTYETQYSQVICIHTLAVIH